MMRISDIIFFGTMLGAVIIVYLMIFGIVPMEYGNSPFIHFWWVLLLPYVIIKMIYIFFGR